MKKEIEILLDHFINMKMFLIPKRNKTVIINETSRKEKFFTQWK